MKNLKYVLLLVLALSTHLLFSQTQIDLEKSQVEWTGKKVTGSHNGTIQLKKAKLDMHDNHLHGGKFVMDMMSIKNLDIENEKYKIKLEKHLKSDDFFGVENFPEAVLKITKEASFRNGEAHIHAELTIKGKTHPIEFAAKKEGKKIMATLVVDRSKYNIRYKSKSFFENLGDKMIYDDFTIDVTLSLN